uniref:Uncharacterized protein n=1 Tax=Heterorhabditis bacteriophora TaxID=37862 RepID=A0A1I7WKS6_HETBA
MTKVRNNRRRSLAVSWPMVSFHLPLYSCVSPFTLRNFPVSQASEALQKTIPTTSDNYHTIECFTRFVLYLSFLNNPLNVRYSLFHRKNYIEKNHNLMLNAGDLLPGILAVTVYLLTVYLPLKTIFLLFYKITSKLLFYALAILPRCGKSLIPIMYFFKHLIIGCPVFERIIIIFKYTVVKFFEANLILEHLKRRVVFPNLYYTECHVYHIKYRESNKFIINDLNFLYIITILNNCIKINNYNKNKKLRKRYIKYFIFSLTNVQLRLNVHFEKIRQLRRILKIDNVREFQLKRQTIHNHHNLHNLRIHHNRRTLHMLRKHHMLHTRQHRILHHTWQVREEPFPSLKKNRIKIIIRYKRSSHNQ